MADEERVERRLLLSVDARGYGGAPGWMQEEIQRGLLHVLDAAAGEAGLHRETWDRQAAGDGELAVLPLEEPEVRVVQRFPRELKDALRKHNRSRTDEARLQLRMAVHFGTAKPGPNGYQHAGPVVVSRLCDSEPLKRMLVSSDADLVAVFSRQIYTDTIEPGLALLDLAELHRVRVTIKEFDEDAWIWVPGVPQGAREPVEVRGRKTVEPAPPRGQPPGPEPESPCSGGPAPLGVNEHDVFRDSVVPAARHMPAKRPSTGGS